MLCSAAVVASGLPRVAEAQATASTVWDARTRRAARGGVNGTPMPTVAAPALPPAIPPARCVVEPSLPAASPSCLTCALVEAPATLWAFAPACTPCARPTLGAYVTGAPTCAAPRQLIAVLAAPDTVAPGVSFAANACGSGGPPAAYPITSYTVVWGDGTTDTQPGCAFTHAYATAGLRTATLTVSNGGQDLDGTAARAVVAAAPGVCGFGGAPASLAAADATCTECPATPGLWSGAPACGAPVFSAVLRDVKAMMGLGSSELYQGQAEAGDGLHVEVRDTSGVVVPPDAVSWEVSRDGDPWIPVGAISPDIYYTSAFAGGYCAGTTYFRATVTYGGQTRQVGTAVAYASGPPPAPVCMSPAPVAPPPP